MSSLLTDADRQALHTLRVMWGAMLGGVVVFAAVVVAMKVNQPGPWVSASVARVLKLVMVTSMVALPFAGLLIRHRTYKAHWRADRVTAGGYRQGNIVLFACLEGVGLLAGVYGLVSGVTGEMAFVVIVALIMFGMNFPNGRPMLPAPPDLAMKR